MTRYGQCTLMVLGRRAGSYSFHGRRGRDRWWLPLSVLLFFHIKPAPVFFRVHRSPRQKPVSQPSCGWVWAHDQVLANGIQVAVFCGSFQAFFQRIADLYLLLIFHLSFILLPGTLDFMAGSLPSTLEFWAKSLLSVQPKQKLEGTWATEDFMEQNCHTSSGLPMSRYLHYK